MRFYRTILVLWLLTALNADAKVIAVSGDGTGDFRHIQAAIDAAMPGDTVGVIP